MQIRFQNSPAEFALMNTQQLRANFLVENILQPGVAGMVYTHYDRMIIGGVVPLHEAIFLNNEPEFKAAYFLERREAGIINLGNSGTVTADGNVFEINKYDCLYLGKGTQAVTFKSNNPDAPAKYYFLSAPAHQVYPNKKVTKTEVIPLQIGNAANASKRSLYQYIHNGGVESCQLVMGITLLEKGSVWNSVPPHTHTRRMEVYFYFDLEDTNRVVHFMGTPQETRHLLVSDYQAVVSPPWSMHFGVGTSDYGFVWGMAGENKEFSDMDSVGITEIR